MNAISRRQLLTGAAGLALLPCATRAQTPARPWPRDTVRLMVPGPAGGPIDLLCRQIADRLGPLLGAKVIVDNRAGAAGLIGAKALAGVPPDGSMIGYLHAGHLTLQAMGAKIDMANEFIPVVGRYSASHFVIAVNSASPHRTLAELIRAIQANPGKLTFGTGGQGSPGHLVVEKLRERLPTLEMVHVPYKGAIEAVNSLVGKDLDFVSGLMSAVAPQVASGRLRALAVSGELRSPLLPQVPTVAESGYPGFSHSSWGGIYLPAKTPAPLVDTLRAALRQVEAQPDLLAFIASTGSEFLPTETPEAFAAYFKQALASEAVLVKKLGLSLQ